MCGAQSFRGRAGNPAPEPMSRTRGGRWSVVSGRWSVPLFGQRGRARKKDSPKGGGGVVSGQWSVVSTAFWEEVAGQEKGLAEVAGYDFFWMADGGQVDAGV